MIEWNQCVDCNKPTSAGLVCYDCASKIIKAQQAAGPMKRVRLDGFLVNVPVEFGQRAADVCPACSAPRSGISDPDRRCRHCGYRDTPD